MFTNDTYNGLELTISYSILARDAGESRPSQFCHRPINFSTCFSSSASFLPSSVEQVAFSFRVWALPLIITVARASWSLKKEWTYIAAKRVALCTLSTDSPVLARGVPGHLWGNVSKLVLASSLVSFGGLFPSFVLAVIDLEHADFEHPKCWFEFAHSAFCLGVPTRIMPNITVMPPNDVSGIQGGVDTGGWERTLPWLAHEAVTTTMDTCGAVVP